VRAAGLAFWAASAAELITYDCRSFFCMPCIDRSDIPPLPTGPLVACNQGVSYAWKFPGSSIAILYTIFATPELLLFYNSAVLIVVELYV
jgi:hypothetical protein